VPITEIARFEYARPDNAGWCLSISDNSTPLWSRSQGGICRAPPDQRASFPSEKDVHCIDVHGGPKTLILSYGFWQRRFRTDPAVLGCSVILNGNPVTSPL
jgi:hypothetical protein